MTPIVESSIKDKLVKFFRGKNGRRNIIVLLIFIAAFAFVYYKYFNTTTPTTYEYATATVKDIKETVEGSGKVESVSELDIQQLQGGGKVTSVRVKPGDYVKQGQIIATLDNRQQSIQLAQSRASYQKIVNGSTQQQLDIANQNLINAKTSYESTRRQQDLTVANAHRTLLNTGLGAVSQQTSLIQPNTPTITGSYTCDEETSYHITNYQSGYVNVDGLDPIQMTSVPQPLGKCGLFISFDPTKDYSNGVWNVDLPNKTSTSYATNLNAYNNALVARDTALQNASTSIINAQLSLNQTTAGSRPEDIASARASLESAELSYDNTIIRAPFDGQIGSVSAAVGQQTNSQQGVATILTKDKIADISLNEIDIVNVKLGQSVDLSFDAIPNETFKGIVAQIDTVGVQTSNVVSFDVKISIPNADERIKSGMSVSANIIINEKDGILTVPSATIKSEGKGDEIKYYVLRKKSTGGAPAVATDTTGTSTRKFNRSGGTGTNEKVYVTVGITNNIDTEITGGINEGEQVVSKTVTAAKTTTTTSFSLFGGGPRVGGGGGNGGANRTGGGATAR